MPVTTRMITFVVYEDPELNLHSPLYNGWIWVVGRSKYNEVVVSNMFYFQPYLGKIPILTNIFQMGWNHQPDNLCPLQTIWGSMNVELFSFTLKK